MTGLKSGVPNVWALGAPKLVNKNVFKIISNPDRPAEKEGLMAGALTGISRGPGPGNNLRWHLFELQPEAPCSLNRSPFCLHTAIRTVQAYFTL